MDNSFKLLLNDENYKKLKQNYFENFNIFNVLKLVNNEFRHSNFLAWLLTPSENHGYGADFLKKFLGIKGNPEDVSIEREKDHIDILITYKLNKKDKLCLIENKIWSDENNGQLKRYGDKIASDKNYKKYTKENRDFIYLTPFGNTKNLERTLSDGTEIEYRPKSYKEISEILSKKIEERTKRNERTVVDDFIEQYIDMLDIQILKKYPEKMKKLCKEIYKNYKEIVEEIAYCNDDTISGNDKAIIKTINKISNHRAIVFNLTKEILLEQDIDLDNLYITDKTARNLTIRFLPNGIKNKEILKFPEIGKKKGCLKNIVHIDIRHLQLHSPHIYIEVVVGSQTERNDTNKKETERLVKYLRKYFGKFGKVPDNWYFTSRRDEYNLFDLNTFENQNENDIKKEIKDKLERSNIIDTLRNALNNYKEL